MHGVEHSMEVCTEDITHANNEKKMVVKELEGKITKLETENALLQKSLKKVEERQIYHEAQSHRDNLVIDGVTETEPEDCLQKVKHIFTTNMGLNVDNIKFVRCHRLGAKKNGDRP